MFKRCLLFEGFGFQKTDLKNLVGEEEAQLVFHQLRLIIFPIAYRVLAPLQVVLWNFFHQLISQQGCDRHVPRSSQQYHLMTPAVRFTTGDFRGWKDFLAEKI